MRCGHGKKFQGRFIKVGKRAKELGYKKLAMAIRAEHKGLNYIFDHDMEEDLVRRKILRAMPKITRK